MVIRSSFASTWKAAFPVAKQFSVGHQSGLSGSSAVSSTCSSMHGSWTERRNIDHEGMEGEGMGRAHVAPQESRGARWPPTTPSRCPSRRRAASRRSSSWRAKARRCKSGARPGRSSASGRRGAPPPASSPCSGNRSTRTRTCRRTTPWAHSSVSIQSLTTRTRSQFCKY